MIPCRTIMALSCVLTLFPACALSHFAHGTEDVQSNDDRFVTGDAATDRSMGQDTPIAVDVQPDLATGTDVQPDLVVGMDIPPTVDVQPDIPPAIDVQPDIPPAMDVQPDVPPAMDVQPDIPPAIDVQPDVPPTTLPPGSSCSTSGGLACASPSVCDTFQSGATYCAYCGGYGQRGCGGVCREGYWDSFADVCYRSTGWGTAGGPCIRNSDCGTQCVNGHCIVCGSAGDGCCCDFSGCSCNAGLTCTGRSSSSPWTVCH